MKTKDIKRRYEPRGKHSRVPRTVTAESCKQDLAILFFILCMVVPLLLWY